LPKLFQSIINECCYNVVHYGGAKILTLWNFECFCIIDKCVMVYLKGIIINIYYGYILI